MISIDTNVFVYAVDQRDLTKQAVARSVINALGGSDALVALQVVGEFQNALKQRLKMPAFAAAQAARLAYWDALLVAAADAVGVTTLISEDMADGSIHGAVEILNPFGPAGPSPRIRSLLAL